MKEYVDIPENLCNYIEGLMYETNARKDVITFMLSQDNINEERFKQYHDEYLTFYAKYETAKSEITNNFIIPKYGDTKLIWNLNFSTNQLEVTILN